MKQNFFAASQEQKLRKNSIDEGNPNLYTVFEYCFRYHMAGNSLPKEDIEEIVQQMCLLYFEEYQEDRFTERYITVISCCCCPEFCSETDKQKSWIIHLLKILNCQMAKISWKRIYHNNYVWKNSFAVSLGYNLTARFL